MANVWCFTKLFTSVNRPLQNSSDITHWVGLGARVPVGQVNLLFLPWPLPLMWVVLFRYHRDSSAGSAGLLGAGKENPLILFECLKVWWFTPHWIPSAPCQRPHFPTGFLNLCWERCRTVELFCLGMGRVNSVSLLTQSQWFNHGYRYIFLILKGVVKPAILQYVCSGPELDPVSKM